MKSLQTIGVIGAGPMGSGGAQISAHAGLSVPMADVNELRVAHRYVQAAAALVSRLGKTPVIKDSPGDAIKRLLCPMPNEAVPAYSLGLASVEDIVKAMQLGCNHPAGLVVERLRTSFPGVLEGWPPA